MGKSALSACSQRNRLSSPLVWVTFWLFSLIISLGLLTTGYAERRRQHAFGRLEQANNRLEQINKALDSFVDTFSHETRRLLRRIPDAAYQVAAGDVTKVARIEKLVEDVTKRLWDSTEKFEFEERVRKAIAANEPDRFNLSESVVSQMEMFLDDEVNNIEFQTLCEEDCQPFLSATGAPNNPDHYFRQVLEKVVENADDYREPTNSPILILLEVAIDNGLPHAVLKVSNYGPTVEKNKLEAVFDLGSRHTETKSNDEDKDHQGLGLFLTRQIVSAYGGSCRLDNMPDEKGVIFTFRLPIECGTAADLRH